MKVNRYSKQIFLLILLVIYLSTIMVAHEVSAADRPGFKRSDFESLGGWNEIERNKILNVFAPTVYKVAYIFEVPDIVPTWFGRSRLHLLSRPDVTYARIRNLKMHSSIHMYHRQPNYPDSAVKIGIDGEFYEKENKSIWKMCTGHDEFREAVIRNIKTGIDLGVTIFEFQDTTLQHSSCFCDKCVIDFRRALLNDSRMIAHKKAFKKKEIDINTFNVRQYAYKHTKGTPIERHWQFFWKRNEVVGKAWRAFKFYQLHNFLENVISEGRAYGETKGKNITFLIHFCYLSQIHLDLIDLFDGMWAETPLSRYVLVSDPGIPMPKPHLGRYYFPPSGIMGACASVLAGVSGGKLAMWMPWGVPFPELAFKKGKASILYQIWLAETYASGGIAGIVFKFSRDAYKKRKVIIKQTEALSPTFFDPKRNLSQYWYTPEGTGDFTRFFRQHSDLFDGYIPACDLLLLKTRNGYNIGSKKGENIFGWAELLGDAHIPYEVFIDGNGKFMQLRLSSKVLGKYRQVIALGNTDTYSIEHFEILKKWLSDKNHVLYVEDDYSKWLKKLGQFIANKVKHVEDMGTEYQRSRRSDIWIQKAIQTVSCSLNTTLNKNCLIRFEKKTVGSAMIWTLHLVNRNYEWFEDKVIPQTNVQVILDRSRLGLPDQIIIKTYNLNNDITNQATCSIKEGLVRIKLPVLNMYSVIQLQTKPTLPSPTFLRLSGNSRG